MAIKSKPPRRDRKTKPNRIRLFWARVTDGLELSELWGQFQSEARSSYRLYSADVDWEEIDGRSRGKIGKAIRSVWALFQAMLMKLSPARRVLLLAAIFFLIFHPTIHLPNHRQTTIEVGGIGVAILFVLLAVELADRVTMKRDLEIAREIQEWLVPEHPPLVPGLDIAFATRPQNTVAGDYFDAFVRAVPVGDAGHQPLLIVVADVAGKSIPAALLMATFQASLHTLTATSATLDEIVFGLDRYCRAHSLDGRRFTTAFIGQLNLETRELVYVNAGHNDPIVRRASGKIERLSTGGPPFGIPQFPGRESVYPSGRVQLEAEDIVFIFTDGVVEAINDREEDYGEERLLDCLKNPSMHSAQETLDRVMTDVNTFVGPARQYDDITGFVLHVRNSGDGPRMQK
ncbi:MAG: PP2C family protein-serine/threonine phosphatase [Acidobacteriota bacterium]